MCVTFFEVGVLHWFIWQSDKDVWNSLEHNTEKLTEWWYVQHDFIKQTFCQRSQFKNVTCSGSSLWKAGEA